MQNEDNGWGFHIEDDSTMLSTSFNYIALRLLGEDANFSSISKARQWILDHGGLTMIPSWGKMALSVYIIKTFIIKNYFLIYLTPTFSFISYHVLF